MPRRAEQFGYGPDSSGLICAYLFATGSTPRARDTEAAVAGRFAVFRRRD